MKAHATICLVALALINQATSDDDDFKGWQGKDETLATRAIHVGEDPDYYRFGPVVLPIYMTTTFKQDAPGKPRTYKYSRDDNPTRAALELLLASLDDGKYGIAFSSGTAAITAVAELVHDGGHVICADQVFGGTYRYFKQLAQVFHNVSVTFVNQNYDSDQAEEVRKAIQPNTKMVWFDGLSNPLMVVCDIVNISEMIKETKPDIIFVVDNTFVSPYFSKPLKLGADIVLHSLTKYINGHSDVTAGGVITNNQGLYKKLKLYQSMAGAVPSPMDCAQVIRGAKTLEVRMQQHMRNGLKVAKFLESHKNVEQVLYPGLKSHPQHELAKSMWSGASGMMSFYLNSSITNEQSTDTFLTSLKYFALGMSLGGVESLAELPFKMLDEWMTQAHRYTMGVSENLIRISTGIENEVSLIGDLKRALDKLTDPNQ
uniref:cystathionine gamma-lyase n=1 Tax=Lygus hesperus TaxID=30085 RepID=A0A0K8T1E6_LYGHE